MTNKMVEKSGIKLPGLLFARVTRGRFDITRDKNVFRVRR